MALNVDDDVSVLTPVLIARRLFAAKKSYLWVCIFSIKVLLKCYGFKPWKQLHAEMQELGIWSSGMILALDMRGPEFDSRNAPFEGSLGVTGKVLPCDQEVTGSSHGNNLLQKYRGKATDDPTPPSTMRLKTRDFNSSSIKDMKSVVSGVVDANLDVTWLQQYLDEIFEEEDMEEKSSYLMLMCSVSSVFFPFLRKGLKYARDRSARAIPSAKANEELQRSVDRTKKLYSPLPAALEDGEAFILKYVQCASHKKGMTMTSLLREHEAWFLKYAKGVMAETKGNIGPFPTPAESDALDFLEDNQYFGQLQLVSKPINVHRIIKEHDRQIQESVERAKK
ncbi:hypothetical protein RND71_009513 [Anisodus tanguticus]|uniref:Uncharacterized protein n=1 Tax=Anisodus tanguticus TaxID=243964 RepID=A0AAE1SIK1_9SOLA|nr:hypothetical protein RND71_009513 [Anisodus tanguticus]